MAIVHSCDSLEGWVIGGGIANIDTIDKVEGSGSIVITGDGTSLYSSAIYSLPVGERDWSNILSIILRAKAQANIPLDFFIYAPDWNNRLQVRTRPSSDVWMAEKHILAEAVVYGTPNLSDVRAIRFMYRHAGTDLWFKFDAVETSEVIPAHVLTVNSTPISGVSFTLGGEKMQTPWTGSLAEGTYAVTMPYEAVTADGIYRFVQWENGSTELSRIIDLFSDISIEATYEYVAPPPTPPIEVAVAIGGPVAVALIFLLITSM